MIGRKVVELLVDAGAKVKTASLDNNNPVPKVEHHIVNLSNFEYCLLLTYGMDFVFHLAGVKGSPIVTADKPASFMIQILMMNTNILEACRLNKVGTVVYTSSKAVYDADESYAGWAKKTGEKQIEAYRKQYDLHNFYIIRLHNVFGEGDNFDPASAMVIPSLMAKIARGDDPIEVWGDGTDVRDFAYSGDVASQILGIVEAHQPDTTASIIGDCLSMGELVSLLRKIVTFNYHFTKPTRSITLFDNPEIEKNLRKTWEWFKENRDEYRYKQNYFA